MTHQWAPPEGQSCARKALPSVLSHLILPANIEVGLMHFYSEGPETQRGPGTNWPEVVTLLPNGRSVIPTSFVSGSSPPVPLYPEEGAHEHIGLQGVLQDRQMDCLTRCCSEACLPG